MSNVSLIKPRKTIYPTHVLDLSLTLYLLPVLLTSDTIQMKAEILNVDLMSVNYVISQPKTTSGAAQKVTKKFSSHMRCMRPFCNSVPLKCHITTVGNS